MKGYRTMILSLLTAILPVLQLTEWQGVLPANIWPWYCLGLSILMALMRALTSSRVGSK